MLRAIGETRITGVATTLPADVAILSHPDFAAVDYSTKWVEETLDLSGLVAETARRAAAAPAGDEEVPTVERDVTAEVDGRRYSVRLWVPDLGPAVGAGPAGRTGPSAPRPPPVDRHGVGPGHRADAGHHRQGARGRRRRRRGRPDRLPARGDEDGERRGRREGGGGEGSARSAPATRSARATSSRSSSRWRAAPDTVAAAKDAAAAVVDRHLDELVALSHFVHEHPELCYGETVSSHAVVEALRAGGLEVARGRLRPGHGVRVPHRHRRPDRGGVRRVRRAPRDRPRLRPQHHRRHRGRCRPGTGVGGRRRRAERTGARHAGRGGRRRQDPDARARRLRRRARRDDGAPLADRAPDRHVSRGGALRRPLRRPPRARLGRAVGRRQCAGRADHRPGGDRRAAPAAARRATRSMAWSPRARVRRT